MRRVRQALLDERWTRDLAALGPALGGAVLVEVDLESMPPQTLTGFTHGMLFTGEILVREERVAMLLFPPIRAALLWAGLSSTGGFLGAAIGCGVFCWRKGIEFLEYGDPIAYGLPLGWCFGRMGCSVAHDHPGMRTDFLWLAVDYPDGPRFDLGFIEMLFTLCLMTGVFLSTIPEKQPDGTRAPRIYPPGVFLAVICIAYAPVRFVMDFLRAPPAQGGDVRYVGLTPAQWGMVALLLVGVGIAVESRRRARAGKLYTPALAGAGGEHDEPAKADAPATEPEASARGSEGAEPEKADAPEKSRKPHKARKAKS